VQLNGVTLSSPSALAEPDMDAASGGTWFIAASGATVGNGAATKLSEVSIVGQAVLDDVVLRDVLPMVDECGCAVDSRTFVITVLPAEQQGELDSDGDGIPDAWEQAHGLNPNNADDAALDSDGDGFTNYEEYIAGTDPRDADSFLRAERIAVGSTTVGVKFRSVEGRVYGLESRDSLDAGTWSKVVDNVSGTGNAIEIIDPAPAVTARFYRLSVSLEQ
jgi:hypothetical protein